MSASNLLGATQFGGTLGEDNIFKAVGTVSMPIGGGPVNSSTSPVIPYLKASDLIVVYYVSGGTIAGGITTTIANPGLVNAALTITSAGAVAGSPAIMGYMVFAGRT